MSLRLSNVTIGNTSCCGAKISMLKPDGTTVVPPILVGTFGATINATLPVTGTYSIVVDPQQAYVGGITLTLSLSRRRTLARRRSFLLILLAALAVSVALLPRRERARSL